MRSISRSIAGFALLTIGTHAAPVSALDWPDTTLRLEHGLRARDVVERRQAARDLMRLSAAAASPLVLAAMGDTDAEVRRSALRAARKHRLISLAEQALTWLGDPEAHVRAEACEYFRALPDARAVPQLARALSDGDVAVRVVAALALGASRAAEAVPPLQGKLDDPNPGVRVAVARALGRLGDDRAVLSLAGKIQDTAIDVRREVTRSLGLIGDPRGSAPLLAALHDADPGVRLAAVTALGQVHADEAVAALDVSLNDSSPEVRRNSARALGAQRSPAAAHALARILGGEDDATPSSEARTALVSMGPLAIPALLPLLERNVRTQAARSALNVLGRLGSESGARPVLLAALRRGVPSPDLTLNALADAGTEADVPVLLEYLSDKRGAVREAALTATLALVPPQKPDGRILDPLTARLSDPALSRTEKSLVLRLLGRTGPRGALLLGPLTADADAAICDAATSALAEVRGELPKATEDVLLALLAHGTPEKRLAAARALGNSGSSEALNQLLSNLESGVADPTVGWVAVAGMMTRFGEGKADAQSRIRKRFVLASGAERDAILEVLGHVPKGLVGLLPEDASDGDKVAFAMAAASPAGALDIVALRRLSHDRAASVRAAAVAAIGLRGDASDRSALSDAVATPDIPVAANAAAALGEIALRSAPDVSSEIQSKLCTYLVDPRAYVRANATVALTKLGASCQSGLEALLDETSPAVVRERAARWAARLSLASGTVGSTARAALRRCAGEESTVSIAEICARGPANSPGAAKPTHEDLWTTIYVVSEEGGQATATRPFALELGDYSIFLGVTDRRGAVVLPQPPPGPMQLLSSIAESR